MRLTNPFWEPPCDAYDAVVEWFYSDEVATILLDARGYCLSRTS